MSRDLTCTEVVELVTDHLEGVLPADERAAMETHLGSCEGCRIVLEEARDTIRLTGMLTEDQLTEEQCRTLQEAFRGWTSGGAS